MINNNVALATAKVLSQYFMMPLFDDINMITVLTERYTVKTKGYG